MPLFGPPNISKLESERNVPGLIKALKYHGAHERRLAASALGDVRDALAVEPLIAALKDKDWDMRCIVAEALGKIGDPRAGLQLLITLVEALDWRMPKVATEALINIGKPVVEPLIGALKDSHEALRVKAAEILGKLGDREAVEPLIAVLSNDEDVLVRIWAAIALGQLGDTRAVEPLINSLTDNEPAGMWGRVCEYAVESLGQLGDRRAVEPLLVFLSDGWQHLRLSAAIALGRIGDARATESLIAALKDEFAEVRIAATNALISIGEHKGVLAAKARVHSMEQTVDELCVILDNEKPLDRPREESICRAQELGKLLNNQGGFELMQRVMRIVIQRRPFDYQRLNNWWDGIGRWRY